MAWRQPSTYLFALEGTDALEQAMLHGHSTIRHLDDPRGRGVGPCTKRSRKERQPVRLRGAGWEASFKNPVTLMSPSHAAPNTVATGPSKLDNGPRCMDNMLLLNNSAAGVGSHSFQIPVKEVEVYYAALKLLPVPRELGRRCDDDMVP
jgi:hypothetical protein